MPPVQDATMRQICTQLNFYVLVDLKLAEMRTMVTVSPHERFLELLYQLDFGHGLDLETLFRQKLSSTDLTVSLNLYDLILVPEKHLCRLLRRKTKPIAKAETRAQETATLAGIQPIAINCIRCPRSRC